jgi:hypothetical protein
MPGLMPKSWRAVCVKCAASVKPAACAASVMFAWVFTRPQASRIFNHSKFQENQEFLESFPIEFNDWKLGGMTYHDGGFAEYGNAGITIRSIKPLKKHLNKFVDRFNDEALFR